jgi:hypothetical protein
VLEISIIAFVESSVIMFILWELSIIDFTKSYVFVTILRTSVINPLTLFAIGPRLLKSFSLRTTEKSPLCIEENAYENLFIIPLTDREKEKRRIMHNNILEIMQGIIKEEKLDVVVTDKIPAIETPYKIETIITIIAEAENKVFSRFPIPLGIDLSLFITKPPICKLNIV